jgi:signal peptidase II
VQLKVVACGRKSRSIGVILNEAEDEGGGKTIQNSEFRINGERMKKKKTIFWIVVVVVLILDRIAKELAGGIPAEGIVLVPGVIGLRYAENVGVAFSLLSGYPRVLGVLSLALIVGGYIWLRKKELAMFPLVGLALMAGGAAGNMFDRLIRGFVPDMIETLFMNFPVFNIADSCLVIGCILMMISLLCRPKDWANG